MNNADPSKSSRLARILQFLRDRGSRGATSAELSEEFKTVAVGTCVSEIRHSGYVVDCSFERKTESGNRVYRYFLREAGGSQKELFA